jgi:hypothetical protein
MEQKKADVNEMEREQTINRLLYRVNRCIFLNEMLIQQCDTWLSPEEGNRNMMKAIEQRRQAECRRKWAERRTKCVRFFIFPLKAFKVLKAAKSINTLDQS